MQLLYRGFSQQANVRSYHFERALPAERAQKAERYVTFEMNADLSLLARYHIPLQDGPALCLRILTAALDGAEGEEAPFDSYAVTTEDLAGIEAERKAVEDEKAVRRRSRQPFKPSAASQLKAPQTK